MPWFEGAGAARLDHDRNVVAAEYPSLAYDVAPDGVVRLTGNVDVVLPSGTTHRIPTRVEFPLDYPAHEPKVYQDPEVFRPRTADRHLYPDGRVCLWLDLETWWRPSEPDGLQMFLDQVRLFYARQLFVEARPGSAFPGPTLPHGLRAYLPHLVTRFRLPLGDLPRMWRAIDGGLHRNSPCPCGRRVRFRKCHRDAALAFRRDAEPQSVEMVAGALKLAAKGRTHLRGRPDLRA